MPGALYDANNVVVGNAVLWMKPWTLTPVIVPPALKSQPFDFVAWEAAGWIGAGATHEGFKANVETTTTTTTIEEQSVPVAERVESKSISIEAALAEDTLETIRLAWGGGTITTVATAGAVPAHRIMSLSDDIVYWAACLEMRNAKGLSRVMFSPKNSSSGSGETSFRRAADKRTYPFRLASISPPADIKIYDVT